MSITVDGKTYTLPDQINDIVAQKPGPYNLAIRTVKASPQEVRWASLIEERRNWKNTIDARRAPWQKIKGIEAPFDDDHGGSDSTKFGYWFNYFWNEAREAYDLNPAGEVQLCDAFFALMESNGHNGFRLREDAVNLDNMRLRDILLNVMRVGFKRIQVGPGLASMAPQALDARTMFAMQVNLQGQPVRTLPLGFRGDNRSYDELKNSGFIARARSGTEAVHAEYGMDQAWHPFNLPMYASSLFVRKGKSKDNCLHTVISVASSLQDMLPYPLVSDGLLFKLAPKDPATWTPKDITYTEKHWMRLNIVRNPEPNGPIDKLTTDKYVYVLDMTKGKAFNTQAWQAELNVPIPFPERAADRVLPEQILGVLKVRKHYFYRPSGNKGVMTLFNIEKLSFDFLLNENVIKNLHGEIAPTDIRGVIDREIRCANFLIQGEMDAYTRARNAPRDMGRLSFVCPRCHQSFATSREKITHMGNCKADAAEVA